MRIENNDISIALSTLILQPATEVENVQLNPIWIISYTGILKPTVLRDYESGSQVLVLSSPPY